MTDINPCPATGFDCLSCPDGGPCDVLVKRGPLRLQLSRKRGFRLQEHSKSLNGLDAVNVARPTKWGNPAKIGEYFKIGDKKGYKGMFKMSWCIAHPDYATDEFTLITDQQMACDFHAELMASGYRAKELSELRGKNLACWCPLGSPCHADVLLEIANGEN